MARVKLTEYKTKSLLIGGYSGVSISLATKDRDISRLDESQQYVIKVDQGIKKRGKQGLIRLNITKSQASQAIDELAEKGFSRFIAEPMFPHDDNEEKYLSVERTRSGMRFLYSPNGGVEVEEQPGAIKQYDNLKDVPLPLGFMKHLVEVMDQQHFSFVEINPLVVRDERITLLDAAVLADSAGVWQSDWTDDDIVEARTRTKSEEVIAELNDNSPAAFSFRLLNPDGAIWLLLSGGGASITIADEAANRDKAHLIGNYGEYSGGPTREETQVYTEAVLGQMFESRATKKAIVIAGGVANFTDVKKTFAGIVDALEKSADRLQQEGVKVYIRRGGPNEKEGLAMIREFLEKNNILGSVHGSDAVLTVVIDEVLEAVDV